MCVPNVEPPTPKAKSYVQILRVIMVLQFIIGVLDVSSDRYYIPHGIFGIFLAFILFMTQKLLSHQLLMGQILLGIYFNLDFLFGVLVFFQDQINLLTTTTSNKYSFSIFVVTFVYYLVVTIFVYYPYVEFKKISYKRNPALAYLFVQKEHANEMIQRSAEIKEVPIDEAYHNIKVDPHRKNNDNGIF